jgi:hypothetical protein
MVLHPGLLVWLWVGLFVHFTVVDAVCEPGAIFADFWMQHPPPQGFVSRGSRLSVVWSLAVTVDMTGRTNDYHFCVVVKSLDPDVSSEDRVRYERCGIPLRGDLELDLQAGRQEIIVDVWDVKADRSICNAAATVLIERNAIDDCYHHEAPLLPEVAKNMKGLQLMNPLIRTYSRPTEPTKIVRPVVLFVRLNGVQASGVDIRNSVISMSDLQMKALDNLYEQLEDLVTPHNTVHPSPHLFLDYELTINFFGVRDPAQQFSEESSMIDTTQSMMASNRQYTIPSHCPFDDWRSWMIERFRAVGDVFMFDCNTGADCSLRTFRDERGIKPSALLVFVSLDSAKSTENALLRRYALLDAVGVFQRTTVCAVSSNDIMAFSDPNQRFGRKGYRLEDGRNVSYYLQPMLVDTEPLDLTQWYLTHNRDGMQDGETLERTTSSPTIPLIAFGYQLFKNLMTEVIGVDAFNFELSPLQVLAAMMSLYPQMSVVYPLPALIREDISADKVKVLQDNLRQAEAEELRQQRQSQEPNEL